MGADFRAGSIVRRHRAALRRAACMLCAAAISPLAKRQYVDRTLYDTTSILKLIETRWGLAPLGTRDAAANGLEGAFE